ncbi:MAG: hypothetical protein U0350_00285 [Caldilineaceae bacterium]
MLYLTVFPDQVGALIMYVADLDQEVTSVYRRLEDNFVRRRDTDRDLAELLRQERRLRWKLRALIVVLAFLYFPFACKRFLLGLFSKKRDSDE